MLFKSLINIQNIYASYETTYTRNLKIFLSRGIYLSKIAILTYIPVAITLLSSQLSVSIAP